LTFNRHEGVFYELAKAGHEFHVLLPETRVLWGREWDMSSRPLPRNVKLIGGVEDIPFMDLGQYDLLLAQCFDDLLAVQFSSSPKMVLLMTTPGDEPVDICRADAFRRLYVEWRLASVPVVYAFEYYARAWGLPGTVIEHSVDASDYEAFQYTGAIEAVLTVAHYLKERDDEMGYSFHDEVVRHDIPYKVVGYNPTLPGSGPAEDWDELKSFYCGYRAYLNTSLSGGFLSLLEAMTAGMPVISRSGPGPGAPHQLVIDGYNGFVSDDPQYLREKVKYLLANPDVAKEMGRRARETVQAKHNIEGFVRDWNEALDNAISQSEIGQVGNMPGRVYEVAGLVSDPKASCGKALFSPVDGPREHVLYGPFIHLPAAEYKMQFYLRLAVGNRLVRWIVSRLGAQLTKIDARAARRNEPVAVVDVCCGSDGQVRASRVLRVWDFRPWASYQGFELTFHSNGENLFQFRVFATGSLPVCVDPYRTWASIEALDDRA
jgi:hypothetical protein